MTSWQPFVAAAVAPALVWLLWRAQTLSVELLRRSLLVLDTRFDQKWLYALVSWFGTFLHEVSHALVLLLSGHGVKQFRAGVETGHVLPARMHRGAGTLTFLVAALAPLFVPPALALAGFALLLDGLDIPFFLGPATLAKFPDALAPFFLTLPRDLLRAIASLDLADGRHALVFALMLLGAPGSRPSHVRSRFHGKGDEGDVAALRATIRQHPVPFLAFLGLLYGAFFLAALAFPQAYWYPVEAVWAVALTGIVLALFGALFWGLAGLDGRASPLVAWLGPALFIAIQVAARLLDWDVQVATLNATAVGAWLAIGLVAAAILPRRR